jgi:hypothetical protein
LRDNPVRVRRERAQHELFHRKHRQQGHITLRFNKAQGGGSVNSRPTPVNERAEVAASKPALAFVSALPSMHPADHHTDDQRNDEHGHVLIF